MTKKAYKVLKAVKLDGRERGENELVSIESVAGDRLVEIGILDRPDAVVEPESPAKGKKTKSDDGL